MDYQERSQYIFEHIMAGVQCELSEWKSGEDFAASVENTWDDLLVTADELARYWEDNVEAN